MILHWTTTHTEGGDTSLEWGHMLDNNILDHTHDAQLINTTSTDLVAKITQSPTSVDDAAKQHYSGENSAKEVNDPLEPQSSNFVERLIRQPPIWMHDYESDEGLSDIENQGNLAMFIDEEPPTFYDAVHNSKWRLAMDSEIAAISKNDTWELTDLPKDEKIIGVKWIYKTKLNERGEIDKYNAHLVAKGYTQQHGIDYSEVFVFVARLDTIRLVLAVAAHKA